MLPGARRSRGCDRVARLARGRAGEASSAALRPAGEKDVKRAPVGNREVEETVTVEVRHDEVGLDGPAELERPSLFPPSPGELEGREDFAALTGQDDLEPPAAAHVGDGRLVLVARADCVRRVPQGLGRRDEGGSAQVGGYEDAGQMR